MQTRVKICLAVAAILIASLSGDAPTCLAKKPKVEEGYYSNIPATPSVPPAEETAKEVVPETPPVAPPAVPDAVPATTPAAPAATTAIPKLIYVTNDKIPGAITHATVPEATALFNQRKYRESLKQFEWLDKHGHCNEKTHYYIARCCQQLSQVARAQRNYAWILAYGKDKQMRYYAAYGYKQLSRYAANRTYEGQGNNFQGFRGGGAGSMAGGGGGG